ncbi:Allergen V5/Tpx-1 related protein [Bacillus thermotolerans]|uniref:Allergen V5/Tpx-1 related protein n=2 Tax=Bacillus thermotolerans TaxID=1221996 RepID=A0A0F5IAP1_BACTR|nr:Allergen V5/Tpx-1 related protein [Bacillus thermotolerans]KKB42242.1 Allergen V5/Tpx-1 related protein [Bacillus thermotolerans]
MSIILIVGTYLNRGQEESGVLDQSSSSTLSEMDIQSDEVKEAEEKVSTAEQPSSGPGAYIGKPASLLTKKMGEPDRKDPSAYGYEWWVYKGERQYTQFGVENNTVVTAYAAGDVNVAPFEIDQPVADIFQNHDLKMEVVITKKTGTYRLELSEEDFNMRPLVSLGNIYAQLYIDKFSGTLSSVRFLTEDYLIKQRSYEMVYRGELPPEPQLSDAAWNEIEKGSERQILDLTNIIRQKHGLSILTWEEEVATVAKQHSKDMHKGQYFSHESPSAGDLGDRLQAGGVSYQLAGENIAANYVDGPAAVEGWLNSESHREALLEEEFILLGVGVYRQYYTQNFVAR